MTIMIGHTTNSVGLSSIAGLFASDTLVALLARYAIEPDRSFYQRELARLTGSNLYLVQRELSRLEGLGLLRRTPRGKQVEYTVVPQHPAWPALRDLMRRTVALSTLLSEALQPLDSRVKLAWVFGSLARGDERPDSDIDLMIIGNSNLKEISQLTPSAAQELGRELNAVLYSPAELRKRAANGDHFVAEMLDSPRIWVKGSDDELAALVGG